MSYTKDEIAAFEATLPGLGAFVASQGFGGKTFNDLSRDEVLSLCATVVRGFRESLTKIYEIDAEGIPY
jgi:hypothetical protein